MADASRFVCLIISRQFDSLPLTACTSQASRCYLQLLIARRLFSQAISNRSIYVCRLTMGKSWRLYSSEDKKINDAFIAMHTKSGEDSTLIPGSLWR